MGETRDKLLELVDMNLREMRKDNIKFASPHEAYAKILDEFDDTREELKKLEYSVDWFWMDVRADSKQKIKNERLRKIYRGSIELAVKALQTASMAEKAIISGTREGKMEDGEKKAD